MASALWDPLEPAVAAVGLVLLVLVKAGFHARLARRFFGVFGRYSRWEFDGAAGDRWSTRWGGRGRGRRRRSTCCRSFSRLTTAFYFAELVPGLALERSGILGGLGFGAALFHRKGVRRMCHGYAGCRHEQYSRGDQDLSLHGQFSSVEVINAGRSSAHLAAGRVRHAFLGE